MQKSDFTKVKMSSAITPTNLMTTKYAATTSILNTQTQGKTIKTISTYPVL